MSDTNTNASAFPLATEGGHFSEGMTLRDHFAAKAMQAMVNYGPWSDNQDRIRIAECAYQMSNAMLKVRES
jgi:hypothetical protein